jgi:chromosome partitioning protein
MRIAIMNRKGGVGKSTTAVHLAHGLALTGARVLLVDMDPQGNAGTMLGMRGDGLADFLDGEGMPVQARERLDILTGSRALAGSVKAIARRDYGQERVLTEALERIQERYDHIIMDTAPSLSVLTANALFCASFLMVPVTPAVLAAEGMLDLEEEVKTASKHTSIEIRWILPTMIDYRKTLTARLLESLTARYAGKVLSPIPTYAPLESLPARGQTLFEADGGSPAAVAYAETVKAVING